MSDAEQWLPIKGQAGRYEVSSFGRVRSLARTFVDELGRLRSFPERILKPNLRHGYATVSISSLPRASAKKTQFAIHVLVATAFHGPCPLGKECAHDDGDCFNNHVSNLIWKTYKENSRDMIRHGTALIGSSNPVAVLDERIVASLRRRVAKGERRIDLAEEFGVDYSTVVKAVNRTNWKYLV